MKALSFGLILSAKNATVDASRKMLKICGADNDLFSTVQVPSIIFLGRMLCIFTMISNDPRP